MIRRLHQRDREAGLTLPELLVTMFLMAIIGSLVVTLVSTFSRTITREQARGDSTNVAAIGMNELTRIIRAATAVENQNVAGGTEPMFTYAGRERLVLTAGVDTTTAALKPIRVEFVLDGSRVLHERRTTARAGGPAEAAWVFSGAGTQTSARPIARRVVPRSGSEPYLFTYLDADGNELVPPGSGSLSATNIDLIASIEIHLKIQADDSGRAAPVVITNRVGLTNFGGN